jgi:GNAT superfamily N-acetyltransferase
MGNTGDSFVINNLLSQIYPGPLDEVEEAQRSGTLRALFTHPGPDNPGVFALIETPDYVEGYLSFGIDLRDEFISNILDSFQPFLLPDHNRVVYFNINGRNQKAILLAQSMGFHLDMHGVKLAYRGPRLPEPQNITLKLDGYRPGSAYIIADLLDRAYRPLFSIMGIQPEPLSHNIVDFTRGLEALAKKDGVYSFWINDKLVGVCLAQGDYIRDFAVDPAFQNLGLGSKILTSVINSCQSRGYKDFHLDVAMVNTGARRFYTRHGFVEIGCFADHSFYGSPVS